MAKRRPSGDGMVRKREDGRWEGRIGGCCRFPHTGRCRFPGIVRMIRCIRFRPRHTGRQPMTRHVRWCG